MCSYKYAEIRRWEKESEAQQNPLEEAPDFWGEAEQVFNLLDYDNSGPLKVVSCSWTRFIWILGVYISLRPLSRGNMMIKHRTLDFEVAYDIRQCDKNHKTEVLPSRMDWWTFWSRNHGEWLEECLVVLPDVPSKYSFQEYNWHRWHLGWTSKLRTRMSICMYIYIYICFSTPSNNCCSIASGHSLLSFIQEQLVELQRRLWKNA